MVKIDGIETYFGGKGAAGTYQTIINQIRPHNRLVIPFLGHCAILRNIKPAQQAVALDKDSELIDSWQRQVDRDNRLSHVAPSCGCGIEYLEKLNPTDLAGTVIYCDPPYPLWTRKEQLNIYRYEMDREDHKRFLKAVKQLPCDVLITTYPNELYEQELKDWRRIEYQGQTRNGRTAEHLYMNYRNPEGLLHDYSHLGEDYRERERIKRKVARHVSRLQELPALERNAIIQAIASSCSTGIINGATNDTIEFDENFKVKNVFKHETEDYKMWLFVALHHDKHWNYGYDMKYLKGNKAKDFAGAGMLYEGCIYYSFHSAKMAVAAHARKWIKKVVSENNISTEVFAAFYDWYNEQTQLKITA